MDTCELCGGTHNVIAHRGELLCSECRSLIRAGLQDDAQLCRVCGQPVYWDTEMCNRCAEDELHGRLQKP